MRTPTKKQMTTAAMWLRSVEKQDSEHRDCRAVAAWLDQVTAGQVKSPARVKQAA